MQYMVTTFIGHLTKYRLFESYDEAVIYHDRQVSIIYFENQLRNIEIDTTRTYNGRIVDTRLIEWLDGDKPILKPVGLVTIKEWEEM
ncbi:hypothetical protein [Enterococcus phage VPE25]|nr:hypothetical protein [Enterococcus phage VPE25]